MLNVVATNPGFISRTSRTVLTLISASLVSLTLPSCVAQNDTGLAMSPPPGAYANLKPRSRTFDGSNGDLLYISYNTAQVVQLFSYPGLKPVGKLTGFNRPMGLCSDTSGNVFVTDAGNADITEYAHGGTAPIAVLSDYGGQPSGCSVDPTTGNLAVANAQPGNLAIYTGAQGVPAVYSYSGAEFWHPAYDGAGNLFVAGYPNTYLLELAKGGSSLMELPINKTIKTGYIQWDGTYLAVGNLPYNKKGIQFDRVSVSGGKANVVGTVTLRSYGLKRLDFGGQYWIQGSTIIGEMGVSGGGHGVALWNYPAGGKKTKFKKTSEDDFGATVSVAP